MGGSVSPFFFRVFVLFRSGLDLVLMCHGGVVLLFGRAERGGGSAIGWLCWFFILLVRFFFLAYVRSSTEHHVP